MFITLPIAARAGESSTVSGRFNAVTSINIADIEIHFVTEHTATITWSTNIPATTQLFYDTEYHGEPADYQYRTEEDTETTTEHSVTITGLSSGTSYHFRVRSATGSLAAVSADYTFKARAASSGGGGGTTGYYLKIDLLGETSRWQITPGGRLLEDVGITATDGLVTLCLPEDTYCRDADGERLTEITIELVSELPAAPDGYTYLSAVYRLSPEGATFAPPISLTFNYDDLPAGLTADDLYVAHYDEGAWIPLDSVINIEARAVTIELDHFSLYVVMAELPGTMPEEEPAEFTISDLTIDPATVAPGEAVIITVRVTNTGGTAGVFEVGLYINGLREETRAVDLSPGSSEKVRFSVTRDSPASYAVNIGGLTGALVVREETEPEPLNWPLVAGLIAGAIVAGCSIFVLVRRSSKNH